MNRHSFRAAAAAAFSLALTGQALAHHAMGGETPRTFSEGLISGLAHPVVGVDHLAFILAVGILAGVARAPLWAPLLFVGGTLLGALGFLGGIEFAFTESLIIASILCLGIALAMGYKSFSPAVFGVIGLGGLFHGMAYAEAIIGAEPAPLWAYLTGFGIIQAAIAIGAMYAVKLLWGDDKQPLYARLSGAAVAGFGAAFAIESVEALLFAGVV